MFHKQSNALLFLFRGADPGVIVVDETAATYGGGASYSGTATTGTGYASGSRFGGGVATASGATTGAIYGAGASYAGGSRYPAVSSPFQSGVPLSGSNTPVFSGGFANASYGSAIAGYPPSSTGNYAGGWGRRELVKS